MVLSLIKFNNRMGRFTSKMMEMYSDATFIFIVGTYFPIVICIVSEVINYVERSDWLQSGVIIFSFFIVAGIGPVLLMIKIHSNVFQMIIAQLA